MKKEKWKNMSWSHSDEELEKRYLDWTDKELIHTAGWLLQERSKVLEDDLKSIKAVASSHLSELERRGRVKSKPNKKGDEKCDTPKTETKTPNSDTEDGRTES